MSAPISPSPSESDQFISRLQDCLRDGTFVSLTLGRPHGTEATTAEDPGPSPTSTLHGTGRAQPAPGGALKKVLARRVVLRGEDHLSMVWRYSTRDITRNIPLAQAPARIRELIATQFHHAHLVTRSHDIQLALNRKGRWGLRVGKLAPQPDAKSLEAPASSHDRPRERELSLETPFLAELGVTDRQHRLIPAMARKWRQINKFAEILGHAITQSTLGGRDPALPVRVMDFGAGKGYLTFVVHHLLQAEGRRPDVIGVELREELTTLCNDVVARLGLTGLRFEAGDIADFAHARDAGARVGFDPAAPHVNPTEDRADAHAPRAVPDERGAESTVDIMIALHACDIATDIAMHHGILARAEIILCSPCCHKQLRPQMRAPAVLAPMLRHGIHMTEQAEMLTDSLRALLLQAQGYDTQVFEFISPEHTGKNKMVLAIRRATPLTDTQRGALMARVAELKAFYGVTQQHLETLLEADARPDQPGASGTSSASCAASR